MHILETPYRYFPHDHLPQLWSAHNFCFDQRKLNLLWLVCPEADARWDMAWEKTAIHESIDEYYSGNLLSALILPPLEFMRIWWAERPWELELTRHWPKNYSTTMQCRAHVAAARLHVWGGNVISGNFGARSGE